MMDFHARECATNAVQLDNFTFQGIARKDKTGVTGLIHTDHFLTGKQAIANQREATHACSWCRPSTKADQFS